jgi:hypothetical protein
MIVIKLAFYSLLFLFLVTMIGGPWLALAAFIGVVVYGITDTAGKAATARQLEQKRAIAEEARATADRLAEEARIAADRYAIAEVTAEHSAVLTPEGIALKTNRCGAINCFRSRLRRSGSRFTNSQNRSNCSIAVNP